MSIDKWFTTTITVKRQTEYLDGAIPKVKLVADGTVYGHIQMANADLTQQLGLAMGKTFNCWVASDADIQESDQLTINSIEYNISQIWDLFDGENNHKQLILTRD